MEIKTVTITPAMAKEFLKSNTNNRSLKEKRIRNYAKDMLEDKWICDTGETIKFLSNGLLADGQNRLHAIIKANIPVKMQVAFGLDEQVFKVIDTGCSRNAIDIFRFDKIKYYSIAPSVIVAHNNLLMGGIAANYVHNNSNQNILDLYFERKDFYDNVLKKIDRWYLAFNKVLNPSTIGGFYAFFFDINPIDANEFFEQLTTGNDIKHNAIRLLRNKLFENKLSTTKITASHKHCLIIKTWNYYRKNHQIKFLRFDSKVEEIPKAI
jgi:hypothetical protein